MISLLLGGVAGYLVAEYFSGKDEGECGKVKSIRIKVKEYVLHVHHWLCASVALVVLPANLGHRTIIEAFLIGMIIQGLTYADFYKVVYKPREA
jgi:uncharacterized membrane-anchored protein